ncbi:type II-A CRISPR-associated protein Csn2 [Streptococcus ruminantium]|uniref:type II-A CRISPR-associated protein Csn2 n=1 Tax=Streptococcus ruminantium TaxID=1917441 RepID=UPI0012DEB4EB|nr:type II-A CRISPR-associated protein Csn2 [Streptococcus ruminantium]
MKLNFPLLDEAISLSGAEILVIESTPVYANVVKELYQYSEVSEVKLFDKNFKSLKESELMIITDILGYDVNSASILKLIHADLEEQLNEQPEVKSIIEKLANSITELISYECLESELDLEYDEITILELIKALGVKIETQSDTLFEKIFEILQVFRYLTKKRLLIFVNSLSYFTNDEIKKIVEFINLSQLRVLFLEPRRVINQTQYILDEDYFLLVEEVV